MSRVKGESSFFAHAQHLRTRECYSAVMEELDRFLNENVGSDPSLLHDLYRSLTKERDGIEMQASRYNTLTCRPRFTRTHSRGTKSILLSVVRYCSC